MAQILDPLLFPLHGNRLIEASAGTGKTYTIAALYVRLILGHGGEEYGYQRALTPEEILVVTFTSAATQELRERISRCLNQAANYFLQKNPETDDFLINLRATYPQSQWPVYAHQMQNAAQSMDQAAVSTIHSWCQRMLREHAFHIGRIFNYTLSPDQEQLLTEVFYDYWRIFITPLDVYTIKQLQQWKLSDPQKFYHILKSLLKDISIIDPAPAPPLAKNKEEILRHAVHWIAAHFAHEQQRLRQIGYDELLTQFNSALSEQYGISLAKKIRHQYPVALIDEFQDTDPIQYQIFDKIYHVADPQANTALILIGDPKQSIYAFRGADIYTYLTARQACQDRLYTLKENFRSTVAMVTAVNYCFSNAEKRPNTTGAFLFRNQDYNPVPFLDATAHGLKNQLLIDNSPHPPLTIWFDHQINKKSTYRLGMAAACAQEISRLLNLGQIGAAVFSGSEPRALHPRDLAILVNNRFEAKIIREELLKCGVRTVYLSEQDSVFQYPEARDLQYWLAACAEPNKDNLIRAALATATLNLSWAELDNLQHDEAIWDEYVIRFRNYQDCWRRKGIMPMLGMLLNDFNLSRQLLNQGSDGTRSLTNILHLAELLQQASITLDGEPALIRYLQEQITQKISRAQSDFDQIRLETGIDLVKIVTIHKAKGLTYPLVFLPFACDYKKNYNNFPVRWHNSAGQIQIGLNEAQADKKIAAQEYLAEEVRKFYVALTRAQYATWITIAPLDSRAQGELKDSALGYLLGIEKKSANFEQALNQWKNEFIQINPVAPQENIYYSGVKTHTTQYTARVAQFIEREPWWIASYSALRCESRNNNIVPETLKDEIFQETYNEAQHISEINILHNSPDGLLHDFPQGAETGNLLHGLLEWIAHQGFSWINKHPDELHAAVTRRCNVRNWSEWIEPLNNWLSKFLIQDFQFAITPDHDLTVFSLANLRSYTAELEFWIAAHRVDISKLDRIIQEHTLNQATRPELQSNQINGMLNGFMDLVFEHQGRYYVLDYKSNWLGKDNYAYNQEALQAEILKFRYDLQYILYLFALHRLLKARLPNYNYERQIGGAIYIFLRGTTAPGQGIYFDRPEYSLIEKIDRLFMQKSAQ